MYRVKIVPLRCTERLRLPSAAGGNNKSTRNLNSLIFISRWFILKSSTRLVRLIQKYPFKEAISLSLSLSQRNNLSLHFPFSKFHSLVWIANRGSQLNRKIFENDWTRSTTALFQSRCHNTECQNSEAICWLNYERRCYVEIRRYI